MDSQRQSTQQSPGARAVAARVFQKSRDDRARSTFEGFVADHYDDLREPVAGIEAADRLRTLLSASIGRIDQLVSAQVAEISKHPKFQALAGRWLGLAYLWKQWNIESADLQVSGAEHEAPEVTIKLLSATLDELDDDVKSAAISYGSGDGDFEATALYKHIYAEAFDMPNGEFFGALLWDHEFTCDHRDIELLTEISRVCAAAFCPLLVGGSPKLFGVDSFSALERGRRDSMMTPAMQRKWDRLRTSANAQLEYVAVTVPRILVRAANPCEPLFVDLSWCPKCRSVEIPRPSKVGDRCPTCNSSVVDREPGARSRTRIGFVWQYDGEPRRVPSESGQGRDREHDGTAIWGSAIYAYGTVLVRSLLSTNWVMDTRGIRWTGSKGAESVELAGGIVRGLPTQHFDADRAGDDLKSSTDLIITESLDIALGRLGFLPLCHSRLSSTVFDGRKATITAFHGCSTLRLPPTYEDPLATLNAQISSMLHYVFCACRFAHHIKAIGREKEGSTVGIEEIEMMFKGWLGSLSCEGKNAVEDGYLRFPLRESSVAVTADRRQSGRFNCTFHLRPHPQLDSMSATISLTTRIITRSNPREVAG